MAKAHEIWCRLGVMTDAAIAEDEADGWQVLGNEVQRCKLIDHRQQGWAFDAAQFLDVVAALLGLEDGEGAQGERVFLTDVVAALVDDRDSSDLKGER